MVFEEGVHEEAREPTKYLGYTDGQKSAEAGTGVPNYALLVFDVSLMVIFTFLCAQRKKNAFRLVPVQDSITFEQIKKAPAETDAAVQPTLGTRDGVRAPEKGPDAEKKTGDSKLKKYK